MATGRKDSARGERLFVSLDPPVEVRQEVALWGREASSTIRGARPVGPDSIHLTLAFLGTVDTGKRELVASAMGGLVRPATRLGTAGPLFLPRRRPRALAIEAVDLGDGLEELRRDLLEILEGAIGWKPERSGFLPHMTAARLGREARLGKGGLPPTPALEFEAREVVLYRSILDPAGAIYESLFRVDLDPFEE